jgi:hypothetical protein
MINYATLTRPTSRTSFVQVAEPYLHQLLRRLIPSIQVDEGWYRERYGDVDEAIRAGKFDSAQDHYIDVGYFEGRFPRQVVVDEEWYCSAYLDVSQAIRRGQIQSAREHFEKQGFHEGRLPFEGWAL